MLLSKKLKYTYILFFISLLIVLFVLHTDKIWNQKKQPDIVLVVLDTVRRDYTFLEKKNTTPNLKQFADEGTIFYRAWSNAPWTVPSHASIFTGLLPTEHGCTTKNFFLNKKFKTIAEILNKKGYETAGFYSNPWLSMRATGLMRGFQKHWESHIGGLGRMTRGRGDQGGILTNKRIRDWIKKRKKDRPFFLFVNYLEAHLPYDPPLKYRKEHLSRLPLDDTVSISWAHEFNAGLYDPENIDWRRVRELYEGDVYTEDQLLGELLEILKVNDMYEDSVIIVTSDHGENLGEHHLIEHQFSVHETLLSVPLVVRAPGIIEQGVNHFPVMLTDLFYFIADLAIADPVVSKGNKNQLPPSVFKKDFKKNHGSEKKARYIFSEYAGAPEGLLNVLRRLNPELKDDRLKPGFSTITDGTWRLTLDTEGNVLLHNTKEDPLQRTNVINKYPVIAQKLGEEIKKVIYKIKRTKHPSRKLDKETKKKLESLGYIH